jgi:acyl-CoA thioesterase-1
MNEIRWERSGQSSGDNFVLKILKRQVLVGLAFFFVCTGALHAKVAVVLGDSLSEGYGVAKESSYPVLLEKQLQIKDPTWKVINSSISGSTSASAVGRWKWVKQQKPDLVILALGANDGLRGLQPKEMEKNLDQVLGLISTEKDFHGKILLAGIMVPPNYGKKYSEEFRSVYPRLAKKHKVIFVPFILKDVAGHSELNLADGIHPNEKGHRLIFETLWKSLQGELK